MHRQSFRESLLVGVLMLMSMVALAQSQFPQPPQIPYGMSIGTENAKAVAAAAIAEAQKNHWTMAIAIVDTGAHLVYFERIRTLRPEASTWRSKKLARRRYSDGLAESLKMVWLRGAITFGYYV